MTVDSRSRISIILVSYNSAETIERSVASLLEYAPQCRHDIVLVDNASTDGSADLIAARFPNVHIIRNSGNVGFGVANNIGMSAFPADVYYLHNTDAYLQADVLGVAVEVMREGGYGIAGLPLVYPDGSPQSSSYSFTSPSKWLLQDLKVDRAVKRLATVPGVGGLMWSLLSNFKISRGLAALQEAPQKSTEKASVEPVDWVCGAAFLLTHDTLVATGGFDPKIFLYGEDEDLCRSARDHQIRVGQIRGVVPVIHDFGWGKSKKVNPAVVRLKRESLLYCVGKWFPSRSLSAAMMRGIVNWRYGT